jgi:hypothetical protein
MRKYLFTALLVSILSVSAFAAQDVVSAVAPVVKHPAVLTRTYKGLHAVGHYTGINYIGKKVGHATKWFLF